MKSNSEFWTHPSLLLVEWNPGKVDGAQRTAETFLKAVQAKHCVHISCHLRPQFVMQHIELLIHIGIHVAVGTKEPRMIDSGIEGCVV
jgi:hypothetical protein